MLGVSLGSALCRTPLFIRQMAPRSVDVLKTAVLSWLSSSKLTANEPNGSTQRAETYSSTGKRAALFMGRDGPNRVGIENEPKNLVRSEPI